MTTEELQPQKEREEEDDRLKVGYFAMLGERAPINTEPANCFDVESAYFLDLELKTLSIPDDLRLENLIDEIHEKHHQRLKGIWRKVLVYQSAVERISRSLKRKWGHPPKNIKDTTAAEIVEETPMRIQDRFKGGIEAIITKPNRIDLAMMTPKKLERLEDWQSEEGGLRREFYDELKNYRVASRAYFEMLLEKENEEYVLPKDHPKRKKIVQQNRHLQLVDAAHQAVEVAKTAHHEQGKKRLRKTRQIPFVAHELSTMTSAILDIEPYAFEDEIQIDLIVTLTCCAIHDVVEDTELSIDYIIERFIKNLVDRCDTRLAPFIKTGFEETYRKQAAKTRKAQKQPESRQIEKEMTLRLFQEKVINLIKDTRLNDIRKILKIISKNIHFAIQDKKQALKRNIAGREKTKALLEITDAEIKEWQAEEKDTEKISRTFQEFPEEYDDGKMGEFLIRLSAMTSSNKKRQQALIVKIEDRADNISSLEGMDIEKQKSILRAATTRLIAWCMLDHNLEEFPLYNTLPRLIDETLKAYLRIETNTPQELEAIDDQCMGRLREWQSSVKRFTPPARVQTVLDEYKRLKAAA